MITSPRYRPEMLTLSPRARSLWLDADACLQAFEGIFTAWDQAPESLAARIADVDAAIVEGVSRLGLPRGPVREVEIVTSSVRGDLLKQARKRSTCELQFFARYFKYAVVTQRSEALWATWVHESLHARQPYTRDAAQEIKSYIGYEEGMVEGLTRTICGTYAGMPVTTGTYDPYVACYESLARVAGIAPEILWRELWRHPPGAVRANFFDALRHVLYNVGSVITLADDRRIEVGHTADMMLDNHAQLLPANATVPFDLNWRGVLR